MKQQIKMMIGLVLALLLTVSAAVPAPALVIKKGEQESGKTEEQEGVAAASDYADRETADTEGLKPLYAADLPEGSRAITAGSDSSMFRITACQLTVKDGALSVRMTLGGTGYEKLYAGTGEEALKASEEDFAHFEENDDGSYSYTLEIPVLNEEVDLAAFSIRRQKWYDHRIVFYADGVPGTEEASGGNQASDADAAAVSEDAAEDPADGTAEDAASLLLPDGNYLCDVRMEGGSGKASVESPASLTVKDGAVTARLVFSSPHYDYMLVSGTKYLPVNTEGNSTFEVPLSAFDTALSMTADTTAMSQPHEIEYEFYFSKDSLSFQDLGGLAVQEIPANDMAECFRIFHMEEEIVLVSVNDGRAYLFAPDGIEFPEIPEQYTLIPKEPERIYLAATAVMCQFDALSEIGRLRFSSQEQDGWYIEAARKAMEEGTLIYGGKYSAPDYEKLLAEGAELAIESTMILHQPKVLEKLEQLGIPVLIDRSSYESTPLGRTEWIRIYGELCGKAEEAETYYRAQKEGTERFADLESLGVNVCWFYFNAEHLACVRRQNDYAAAMIEAAGGSYIGPEGETDGVRTTVTLSVESFYDLTKDADILIYNASFGDVPENMADFLAMDPILSDMKAVKDGRVYCTEDSLYQMANAVGDLTVDIRNVLTGENEELRYFRRLA